MIDRTGQVWRKTGGNRDRKYDAVILSSSSKTNKENLEGTLHTMVRVFHGGPDVRLGEVETLDWYEPVQDPWEKNRNLTRIL